MVRRMLTLYENSGGDTDLRPTFQADNFLISTLAKSKLKNAGALVEEVMEQIMREYQIWPDVVTYTSVSHETRISNSKNSIFKVN